MQQCGVQVVDMDGRLDRLKTKIISGPIGCAASDTASGQPAGKPVVVVISAAQCGQLSDGGSSELSAPQNQRAFQQPSLFQVCEKSGDRPVPFAAELSMLSFEIVMVIPRLSRT